MIIGLITFNFNKQTLTDFPHAVSKLTIEILFELFQSIKPRSFSIANYSERGMLQILVAIVEYKTILHKPRRGLCSNWLKSLQVGDEIKGWIREGTFKVPKPGVPLIMVGPGTGIAPFRSILMEREIMMEEHGETLLFFGCRSKMADYHFREDFERMVSNGYLKKLFCAFSRDQENKIYVQHKIREQSALIRELLMQKNGYLMIAGNSKDMPLAVKTAITEIINDDAYVEEMINSWRYQEETWG